ncbi:MAG: AsmA-like C-terminal region-containing protein [Vicinamibacteraceae bacterium]
MTRTKSLILIAGLLILVVLVAALSLPIPLTPYARDRITEALSERFDAKVELASLRVSVLPRLAVAGNGVVLRHRGRTDVPPLIEIESFSADANLWGLFGDPLRLHNVTLGGLQITIPPGGMRGERSEEADSFTGELSRAETKPASSSSAPQDDAGRTAQRPPSKPAAAGRGAEAPLIIGEVVSERAVLRIMPRESGKTPRDFQIHQLTMRDVGANVPWRFRATLTNPTPPGEIHTEGSFGPWSTGEPARTPLEGRYTFKDADLGVFDGIGGRLDSNGRFGGVLERIDVRGRTTTPAFVVTLSGQPAPLETTFHSVVDGTNGNTWLDPVNATLIETPIVAKGGVVGKPGVKGRTISLDVVIDGGRIQDVLRLAMKAKPPVMTGALDLKTAFLLPPGDAEVIDKLQLDGQFSIAKARFTEFSVQEKLAELSQKSRGRKGAPSADAAARVLSDLRGKFVLKQGVLRFSSLRFGMPGAAVQLAGTYALRGERLDFRGTVTLDAKLSELTSGFKSLLLRAVDPLFRREGKKTVVPITISGTRHDPKFGLDIKRAFARP